LLALGLHHLQWLELMGLQAQMLSSESLAW
jgi:hypothetical protein